MKIYYTLLLSKTKKKQTDELKVNAWNRKWSEGCGYCICNVTRVSFLFFFVYVIDMINGLTTK